jgi:hypothetical protein
VLGCLHSGPTPRGLAFSAARAGVKAEPARATVIRPLERIMGVALAGMVVMF